MNPYEVLGVSPNDDEETIKKAYRRLVKKYHPDRYANSPLAEEANEKLKEINLAYDMITGKAQNTSGQGAGNAYGPYGPFGSNPYGGYSTNFEVSFDNVRRLIAMHMLDAAVEMLRKLPQNAEWYYLNGIIFLRRGWYSQAKEYIDRACGMDPQNAEYRAAQNNFTQQSRSFRTYSTRLNPLACCAASLCCSNLFCRYCVCFC